MGIPESVDGKLERPLERRSSGPLADRPCATNAGIPLKKPPFGDLALQMPDGFRDECQRYHCQQKTKQRECYHAGFLREEIDK